MLQTDCSEARPALDMLKKVPGWDDAIAYDAPDRPDTVVFHNGHRLACSVKRNVLIDIVQAGRLATDGMVEGLVRHAMGTPSGKTILLPGMDPNHDDPYVFDMDLWHTKSDPEQIEFLQDAGRPVLLTKDLSMADTIVQDSEAVMEPAPEKASAYDLPDVVSEAVVEPEPPTGSVPQPVDHAAEARPACEPPGLHDVQTGPTKGVVTSDVGKLRDLTDSEVAYACRQYLGDCALLMKGRNAFNGSIGYVREALKVCPQA